jgi:hypothetical protein
MQNKRYYRLRFWLFLVLGFGTVAGFAQSATAPKERQLLFSVFSTATQLPPTVITTPLHLGGTVGAEFRYNRQPLNQLFQTAKLGVSYHQYAQTAVQLYSEFGYRRMVWQGLGAEIRAGAGYLHTFPATEIFKLDNGRYTQKRNFGRPQVMAGAALGLNYALPGNTWIRRVFVDYQFFLQMPFVKNYVPLLPNTVLHLGVACRFPNVK